MLDQSILKALHEISKIKCKSRYINILSNLSTNDTFYDYLTKYICIVVKVDYIVSLHIFYIK